MSLIDCEENVDENVIVMSEQLNLKDVNGIDDSIMTKKDISSEVKQIVDRKLVTSVKVDDLANEHESKVLIYQILCVINNKKDKNVDSFVRGNCVTGGNM